MALTTFPSELQANSTLLADRIVNRCYIEQGVHEKAAKGVVIEASDDKSDEPSDQGALLFDRCLYKTLCLCATGSSTSRNIFQDVSIGMLGKNTESQVIE